MKAIIKFSFLGEIAKKSKLFGVSIESIRLNLFSTDKISTLFGLIARKTNLSSSVNFKYGQFSFLNFKTSNS